MKILYVTKELDQKLSDGGLIVSKQNYEMLETIYGKQNVKLFEINKPTRIKKILNLIFLQDYGVDKRIFYNFKKTLKTQNFNLIFFNGSLYGSLVKYANKKNIKSIVFFHNIEKIYYKDKFKDKNPTIAFFLLKYIETIESKSCHYSNFRIVLNERDKKDLKLNYSIDSNHIMPIVMKKKSLEQLYNHTQKNEKFCLFVGSDFFANQQGMCWFIDNVVPYIDIRLKIVGSISYFLERKYSNVKNVDFIGYVDNLTEYYINSSFIISPIFLGSGMKTKTVEALSFGKSIIGTNEAFIGINTDIKKIGALCNTAEEFQNAIKSFNGERFNSFSYDYFINELSFEKHCEILKNQIQSNFS